MHKAGSGVGTAGAQTSLQLSDSDYVVSMRTTRVQKLKGDTLNVEFICSSLVCLLNSRPV